jgi:YEATS domain-containing protein 4
MAETDTAAVQNREPVPDDNMKRKRGTELVVPICYGTCSFWLGKKAVEYHSHKWTVYVREPSGGDLSHIISKVVFNLHPSFAEPVRTLDKPPYEVTETGWGEFEIGITIHFAPDCGEQSLFMLAPLKLHHEAEPGAPKPEKKDLKKPVVKDSYEEIVFHEPDEDFLKRVKNHKMKPAPISPSGLSAVLGNRDDRDELLRIATARRVVAERTAVLKAQIDVLT